jgi:hypothetical protein
MHRLALSVSLLLALPVASGASPLSDEYFRLQEGTPVIRGFAVEQLEAQPEVFEGSLIDLRGTVAAVLGPERRPLLLLQSPEHGRALRLVLPPGKSLRDWSFLEVGATVRVLCRLPPERRGSDTLEVVLPIPEHEAALAEMERQPAPAEPEAVAPPHPLPARPPAEAALIARYAAGLRHFNPHLADPDARFLTERILEESRARKLDSRLLVATLAVEGSLSRARFSAKGAYLGARPARAAIAALAADLDRRLHRAVPLRPGGADALATALASRRRDLTADKRPSPQQAHGYAVQVIRMYAALRGEAPPRFSQPAPLPSYEARWNVRRWGTPPGPLVGTWEGAGESFVVVINATGSGVAGPHGEQLGLWRESGGYLEFRTGRVEPLRFRWRVSDDRKALTVTRVRADQTVVGTTTLLRR